MLYLLGKKYVFQPCGSFMFKSTNRKFKNLQICKSQKNIRSANPKSSSVAFADKSQI